MSPARPCCSPLGEGHPFLTHTGPLKGRLPRYPLGHSTNGPRPTVGAAEPRSLWLENKGEGGEGERRVEGRESLVWGREMPTQGMEALAGCAEASNPEGRLVTHHLLSPCQPLLPMAEAPPPMKSEIWPVGGGHVDRVKWNRGQYLHHRDWEPLQVRASATSWPAPLLNSDNRP